MTGIIIVVALIVVVIVLIDSHLRIDKANIERDEERRERVRVASEAEKIKFESMLSKAELVSAQFERDQQAARLHEATKEKSGLSTEIVELRDSLSKHQAKEEQSQINLRRGLAYELQVGDLLGKNAVSVFHRGILRGKKDNGIDLIITTQNEVMLIQCKNYSTPWTLHHAEVSSFCVSIEEYKAPAGFVVKPMLVCTEHTYRDNEVYELFRARNIETVCIPFDESYMENIESKIAAIKASAR